MSLSKKNPPSAFLLMDSMRSIGYTFNAAVADIIDNSISARAKNVWIEFPSDPTNLYLAFLDDGSGMSATELFDAMKYGSKGKEDARAEDDLGRFGLGLKSASFSQCTKLTVVSKKDGKLSANKWDLAYVKTTGDWDLLELEEEEISQVPCIDLLRAKREGTLVVWQDFDVISDVWCGEVYRGLLENVDSAHEYLGLIFHRFLSSRVNPFAIFINGEPVQPIDPFLESNKKTEIKKAFDVPVNDKRGVVRHITVTPYLLPYLKDLTDEDKKKLGGVSRISAMQGFYVYRNNRLIIYGTWFRMAYRTELARYARIKVDIPSTLDEVWKIDVKKQSAELPPSIKRQLETCVEGLQFSSRKKNSHRLTLTEDDKNSLWTKNRTRDKTFVYKINRGSPLVKNILNTLDHGDAVKVEILLSSIEKAIPYHDMYTDEANGAISTELTDEDKALTVQDAVVIFNQLREISPGTTKVELLQRILAVDPFRRFDWLKEKLEKELKDER